jgi:hypothetical protein
MPQLFTNNAWSFLNGGITAVATSITLSTGEGARFPTPTGGDYFLLTLIGLTNGVEASWEIVKVTARATDVLTVVRAQEGTSGVAWLSGTRVELRMTAGQATLFDDKYSKAETDAAIANLVDSAPGTLDTLNELAAALGDDANFATTMTNALAGKVDDSQVLTNVPAGAVFTDTLYTHPSDGVDLGAALTGANVISDVTVNAAGHVTGFATRALTAADVGAATSGHTHSYLPLAGGTMTGELVLDEVTETQYSLTGTSIDPANGSIQYKTLSANTTFTEAMANGQSITLMIDDGSGNTVTWPTITWVGGSAPTLPTTGYAVITLWQVGGTLYGAHVGDA